MSIGFTSDNFTLKLAERMGVRSSWGSQLAPVIAVAYLISIFDKTALRQIAPHDRPISRILIMPAAFSAAADD